MSRTCCALPSCDDARILHTRCKVMDSKKAPLWLCFESVTIDEEPKFVMFKKGVRPHTYLFSHFI